MRNKYFRIFWIFSLFILIAFSGCDDGSVSDDNSVSYDDTIVCLGDSLTAGYGTKSFFPYSDPSKAYPAQLQKKVTRDVINSGLSGMTTAGALTRLDSAVLNYDPVIVVIELGANDLFKGIEDKDPVTVADVLTIISRTEGNLQDIVSYIDNGRRKIFLAKFYNPTVGHDFLNQQGVTNADHHTAIIDAYNTMFDSLAVDDDIDLIEDIWAGVWDIHMCPYSYDTNHVHPDATGYEIMADNYFSAMESYLQSQGYLK